MDYFLGIIVCDGILAPFIGINLAGVWENRINGRDVEIGEVITILLFIMISVALILASVESVVFVVFLISYIFSLIIVIAVYRELNDPEAEREVFKFLKLLVKKGIIDNLNAEIFCEQFSKDILKRKSPILIRFNSGGLSLLFL